MKKRMLLLCLACMMLPLAMLAQVTLSGLVTGTGGNPIEGVSVQITGTSTSTSTDATGRFSLNSPSNSGSLRFTSVGYQSQTLSFNGNQGNLTVALKEDVSNLEEVVVTGIASNIKRSNLGNAVATVTAKELTGTTVQPTMDAALYGKFTGSNISANSGAPGGGISVKLRGITSLVANSQPLFIVDGVFYDNSSFVPGLNSVSKAAGQGSTNFQDNQSNRIADLDPEDIERIEILKGASAAAIYGSRAAAGVVMITTKRGRSGKPRIDLSHSVGVQMQLRKLGQRQWDVDKVRAGFGDRGVQLYQAANGQTFDYEDELYGNKGIMNNSRLSISGGNDRTSYFVGFTLKDDEGIVKGTGYKKNSFRMNLDQKVTSFIDLQVNANYVGSEANRGFFNNDNTSTTLGVSYVSTPSWVNLFPDADGNYPNNPLAPSNFLQTRDLITNREEINRILLGGTGTWHIFTRDRHDLKMIARGGLDQYTLETTGLFPRELQFQKDGNGTNGAAIRGKATSKGSNLSAFLLHNFDASTDLNLRTQAGITAENLDQDQALITATQLIGTQTNVDQAGSVLADQNRVIQKDRGFFIQEELNFRDMLVATLGLRSDRSSRNGDPNQMYYYPKGSIAFNVHKLSNWGLDGINQLKLRAAYGESGNFAPFGAIYSPLVPVGIGGSTGSLIDLIRGNPNLQPERQKEFETGIDLGLFNSRMSIEATYYQKNVEDLILQVAVPLSSGFSQAWRNVAALQNRGIEIAVNATPIVTKNFRWNQTTNFWNNRAKITRLDVPAFNRGAFGATLGTFRLEVGKSPSQIVGIGGAEDKVDPATGLAVYGDGQPDFNISSYHNLSFNGLEFSVLMHWKKGGDNINLSTLLSDIFGTSPDFDDKKLDPTGQKTNGAFRLAALGTTARPWVEDASYFRVREIGLSYSLPKAWFRNVGNVRLGLSGRNLINVFKYNSYDPEVSNFGIDPISSNVEVTPFPSAKSVHFTVGVSF